MPTGLDIFTDTDWVRCTQLRRFTSRVFDRHGQQILLHWCKLQANVALSSSEEMEKDHVWVWGCAPPAGVLEWSCHFDVTVTVQLRQEI